MKFLFGVLVILVIALIQVSWCQTTECWKDTYARPVVSCKSNDKTQEQQAGLCYPLCKDGFYGSGVGCWSRCDASGFSNDCNLNLIGCIL